jgi:hypothetical protein
MWRWLKKEIDLSFILNPFYLYCLGFSFAIFVYLWGWSSIYPVLSNRLILFFLLTFFLFILAGYMLERKKFIPANHSNSNSYLTDIVFWLIIFLGLINVFFMGYIPILERSHNYREFGAPVIDPLFNTLSIFFSVFFFQSYLENKKKRHLIYITVILIIQLLIFRRSTIIWIVTSSSFLYLFYRRNIRLLVIITAVVCIPLFSYCFGIYGNVRSNLTRSIVLDDLGASSSFKYSGINYNHYMTYLYISSPLANLQKNINESKGFFNNRNVKDLLFYCLIPGSFTNRLERQLDLTPPTCNLITPELIVGSFYMVSFYSMGWAGMFIMVLFLLLFIFLCLYIIKRWNTFNAVTLSILSATVFLLIFANFLNRLDVIIMLFIYPVLFHFVYDRKRRNEAKT